MSLISAAFRQFSYLPFTTVGLEQDPTVVPLALNHPVFSLFWTEFFLTGIFPYGRTLLPLFDFLMNSLGSARFSPPPPSPSSPLIE